MSLTVRLGFSLVLILSTFVNVYAEKLVVGATNWEPWTMQQGDRVEGITTDIIREIEKREGLEIEIKVLPSKRMLHYFVNNVVDIEPAVSPTWRESEKEISAYTIPFRSTKDIIVMRSDDAVKKYSVEDFKGMVLGTGLGYYYTQGFEEAFDKGEVVRDDVEDNYLNVKKLLLKRIDGAIFDYHRLLYLIKEKKLKAEDFEIVYEFETTDLSMRFHKNKESYIPRFDRRIREMQSDGTIEKIVNKYMGSLP